MHKLVTPDSSGSGGLRQPAQSEPRRRSQQLPALQADSRASKLAALETQDAGNMLDKANKAYLNDADEKTVDQLAYLTKRRIELAEQTIALQRRRELGKTSAQRAEARSSARGADPQVAGRHAGQQTERGTLVTFGDVLFDYDRAELKPGGMRSVQKLADFLNDNPERKVIVEGYTDSTGSAEYNQRRPSAVPMRFVWRW